MSGGRDRGGHGRGGCGAAVAIGKGGVAYSRSSMSTDTTEAGVVRIGLVQMTCAEDRAQNLAKALGAHRRPAPRRRAASSACRSSFARATSARARTSRIFAPRRADPRPDHRGARQLAARSRRSRSSPRSSSSAPRASTTTPRSSSTRTAASSARYRKMHIPDDPLYYEKFYFTPGDLGFPSFADAPLAGSARWSAGTSGFPRRRG